MAYQRFDFITKAKKAKTAHGVKTALMSAQHHLAEAQLIGWLALEQSWQQEVEVIEAIYADWLAGRTARAVRELQGVAA